MKGGMKDFKSFDEALVIPAVNVGTSSAYDGLPFVNAVSFGANGGYVQKYSKYCEAIYFLCLMINTKLSWLTFYFVKMSLLLSELGY